LTMIDINTLAKELHTVMGCQALPERLLQELVVKATGSEKGETVMRKQFKAFFEELHKKAKFRMKFGKNPFGKASDQPEQRLLPGQISECPDFPIGASVDVIAYKWAYTEFSEGAQKFKLKKFTAHKDRLPPRTGLTVMGSYRFLASSRAGVETGAFIVGLRTATGEEYLVDARGLFSSEWDEEEKESYVRARAEAALVGEFHTVRRVLEDLERSNVGEILRESLKNTGAK